MCVIYKDLLQMLVDPLSNFYLYYSLEKTMVLLFQNGCRIVSLLAQFGVAPTEFKRMKTVN